MNPRGPTPESILDADLADALDERLCAPREDDAHLLARVKARVMDTVRSDPTQLRTVRASEGRWEAVCPGVMRKMLWSSQDASSCLVRLEPGAVVEAHLHEIDEECIVLQGTLRIGDSLVLRAGDFHVGRRGTMHEAACSDTGALVYLRGALETA